jgi:hypothetical protein
VWLLGFVFQNWDKSWKRIIERITSAGFQRIGLAPYSFFYYLEIRELFFCCKKQANRCDNGEGKGRMQCMSDKRTDKHRTVKSYYVKLDNEYVQLIYKIKERFHNARIKASIKVNLYSFFLPGSSEEPEYIVHGGDIMVKFKALQSAIVTDSKGSNELLDELLEQKILNYIKSNPRATYETIAEEFLVSISTIKRNISKLTKSGYLERKGGKRYGYWEIKV